MMQLIYISFWSVLMFQIVFNTTERRLHLLVCFSSRKTKVVFSCKFFVYNLDFLFFTAYIIHPPWLFPYLRSSLICTRKAKPAIVMMSLSHKLSVHVWSDMLEHAVV